MAETINYVSKAIPHTTRLQHTLERCFAYWINTAHFQLSQLNIWIFPSISKNSHSTHLRKPHPFPIHYELPPSIAYSIKQWGMGGKCHPLYIPVQMGQLWCEALCEALCCVKRCVKRCVKHCMKRCVKRCVKHCVKHCVFQFRIKFHVSRSGVRAPVEAILYTVTSMTTRINQSVKLFKKYSPLIDRCRKLGGGKKAEKLPWLGFRTPDLEIWNLMWKWTWNRKTTRYSN